MSLERVRAAYGARAAEYVEAVGLIEHASPRDQADVLAWARGVEGPVLDVGCGPGQWTDHLRRHGVDVEGVDPVEAFLGEARRRYPAASYRTGRAEDLGVADGSLGGVLAWFSLIHTDPADIDEPLTEFARCVRPGGGLLLGFFEGVPREPFPHAVTTAYFWSAAALTPHLEGAGFAVTAAHTRTDPGRRPQTTLTARRVSGSGTVSP